MPGIKPPEAIRAVLTPLNKSELHSDGISIIPDTIRSKRAEKRDLFGRVLLKGEEVSLEYKDAHVRYLVYIEPSPASIGMGTTVIIGGDSPDKRREVASSYHRKNNLSRRALGSLLDFNLSLRVGFLGARSEQQDFNIDSWDVSKFVIKEPTQKSRIATVQYEPKIECISDIVENYNGKGALGVTLEFRGFSFLKEFFTKIMEDNRENMCVYSTNVIYKNERASLRLSTIGDILESEVVQKKRINQLFSDEIYIPKLTRVYDPLSMEPVQKNRIVTIGYNKINQFTGRRGC